MLNDPNFPADLPGVVQGLKAAADPTRLRLLALLSHGELAVHEICAVLAQSQPRISRHLRLLVDADLLDRFREQRLVYYRAPVAGRGRAWWSLLRQLLIGTEPQLERDRARMVVVIGERARAASLQLPAGSAEPATVEWTGPQDLAAVLVEELGPVGIGAMLDIGTGTGRMIGMLGRRAQRVVGIDTSASALKLARTRIHGAGLAHVEFQHGDMYRLPGADRSFDLVTLDRMLAHAERPEAALGEAARSLKPGGRLLVVEDFDALVADEGSPLLRLRRLIEAGGLVVQRLHPCDLESGNYLVAIAGRPAAQEREAR